MLAQHMLSTSQTASTTVTLDAPSLYLTTVLTFYIHSQTNIVRF
jgi:hypothetical protein